MLYSYYYGTDSMLHTATLQYGVFLIWIDVQVRNVQTCIAVFVFVNVCLVDYFFGEIKAFLVVEKSARLGRKDRRTSKVLQNRLYVLALIFTFKSDLCFATSLSQPNSADLQFQQLYFLLFSSFALFCFALA